MTSPTESNCKLVLYYQDERVSDTEWSETTKISLSKQTAKRAHDTICGYFQVQQAWDKQLFKSAFSADIQFDWFEFVKKDTPDINCGIRILENRHVVYIDEPESFAALDRGERKVHVTVKSFMGGNEYDLSLEDLRGERKSDLSIVALYNSESFVKHTQCSTNMGFSRFLKVIEPKK